MPRHAGHEEQSGRERVCPYLPVPWPPRSSRPPPPAEAARDKGKSGVEMTAMAVLTLRSATRPPPVPPAAASPPLPPALPCLRLRLGFGFRFRGSVKVKVRVRVRVPGFGFRLGLG